MKKIVILVLLSISSFADAKLFHIVFKIHDINQEISINNQIKIFKELENSVTEINALIPNLSPSQEKWLEDERREMKGMQRIENFFVSKELNIEHFKFYMEEIKYLSLVLQDTTKDNNKENTFYYIAKLSYALLEAEECLTILQKRYKMFPKELKNNKMYSDDMGYKFQLLGKRLLYYIELL